jgi:3-deoxy-D-manno-oct-2-ulosonic acid (Kdo) hydroxylase
MDILKNLTLDNWHSAINHEMAEEAIHALEHGRIVFLPQLDFALSAEEHPLLSPALTHPKRKNISFNPHSGDIHGAVGSAVQQTQLNSLMRRYYQHTLAFMNNLFPRYQKHLSAGRTSLRTVEIAGRRSSYKKDDSRLHVDSFTATPVNGCRILRMFTNINPHGVARVWQTGEPFSIVAKRFMPEIPSMSALEQQLLHLLKITKTPRSSYDHFMLNIHNKMKKNMAYQQSVIKTTLNLPPKSSWIVYTDQVSHAAISGQHVLEQTFYLPPTAMRYPETTPLFVLEEMLKQMLAIKEVKEIPETIEKY